MDRLVWEAKWPSQVRRLVAFFAYFWTYTEATAFCIDPLYDRQQDKLRRRWIHSRVIDSRLLPLYTILCRRAAIMQLRIDQEKSNIFLICHLFLSSSSFLCGDKKDILFFRESTNQLVFHHVE